MVPYQEELSFVELVQIQLLQIRDSFLFFPYRSGSLSVVCPATQCCSLAVA